MNFCMKKDGDFYVSTAGIPGRETRTFMMLWKEVKSIMTEPLAELPFLDHPNYFTLPNGEWGVTGIAYSDTDSYDVDTHNERFPCRPNGVSIEELEAQEAAQVEPEPEPQPVSEPVREMQTTPEPVQEAQPVPEPEPAQEVIPEPAQEPEPVQETQSEPEPEHEVQLEPAQVQETQKPESESVQDIQHEPEPEPVQETQQPEPVQKVEPVQETQKFESEPEPIPQVISFHAMQAGVNLAGKEDVKVTIDVTAAPSDYLSSLPKFVFAPIDEWCTHAPDEYLLKAQGDNYCMLNDWHSKDGYFYIDDIKANVRYIYSDMYSVSLVIKFVDVLAHRNG